VRIEAIKTHKITTEDRNIFKILDQYVHQVKDKSVLAITSKIISICEGRLVKIGAVSKVNLIEQEADYYIPPEESKYNITLTIKRNLLAPTAGIDESNGNGYYILWPKNPQETANRIRRYLVNRYHLKQAGVIITDSKTTPLRYGVTGMALVHSGFRALNNYIGNPDIFGRKLEVTKVNIMDGLAAAAVLIMGEGSEQTPIAVITDIPFVKFIRSNPSEKELAEMKIDIGEDLYSSLLTAAPWKRGKQSNNRSN